MCKHILLLISLLILSLATNAQELNCNIVVNADRLPDGSNQVYKTLETSINEFVNKTQWTDKEYNQNERIECSMILTILEQTGNDFFSGNIQVQSTRPVYNSIYTTPLFNYQDNSLNFSYTEFEPLRYDENLYQSDLISLLSYYANLIIAIDSDSFAMNGGEDYYNTCQKIIDQVENPSNKIGWKSDTNKMNRYNLLKEIQARSNRPYRELLYYYHLQGLDRMVTEKKEAKETILNAIMSLQKIYSNDMTSYIFRIFADAKADEIVQMFSDGPSADIRNLVGLLNKISPTNANKWAEIK